jgi:hypothetical protein
LKRYAANRRVELLQTTGRADKSPRQQSA